MRGSTTIRKAWIEYVDRRLCESATWAQAAETVGHVQWNWDDAWSQSAWNGGRRNIYERLGIAEWRAEVLSGKCCVFELELGREPYPDADIARNSKALAGIGPIFSAIYSGGPGTSDSDGSFSWASPVRSSYFEMDDEGREHERHRILAPFQVPLEVGDCDVARTIGHLRISGGLARWPYGRTTVFVFVANIPTLGHVGPEAPYTPESVRASRNHAACATGAVAHREERQRNA